MHTKNHNLFSLLSGKYRKSVAYLLFAVLYLEMSLPAVARVLTGTDKHFFASRSLPAVSSTAKTPFISVKEFNSATAAGMTMQNEMPMTGLSVTAMTVDSAGDKVDIDGPGQPEMSSFKGVNGGNMVDLFSGDFSYSIPLMDVGGYPIGIGYSSGISMDQEASWVGLGWNINPGVIARNMRGLPDDFNGTDSIGKTQSIKINKTVGVSLAGDMEILGTPLTTSPAPTDTARLSVNLGIKAGIFHNSYNGWGLEYGVNPSINLTRTNTTLNTEGGPATKQPDTISVSSISGSAGVNINNNSQTGLDISPSLSVGLDKETKTLKSGMSMGLSTNYNSRAGIGALQLNTEVRGTRKWQDDARKSFAAEGGISTSYPHSFGISFAVPSYTPGITMPITNTQFSFTGKIGFSKTVAHPTPVAITGYVSKQEIKPEDQKQMIPAYGYLYYTQGNGKSNIIQDFNREKELQFNYKTTPHIAIPQYSYDAYSISGEGTGGMFRPYRGDIGYIHDQKMRTKSKSDRLSIDLGFGTIFHGGVDYIYNQGYSQNDSWEQNNDLNPYIGFRNSDTSYQSVYFRNPGEMAINTQAFYQSIGDDALMRVKLGGSKENTTAMNSFVKYRNGRKDGELAVTQPIGKKERDKRSQVIQYLTAAEARVYGLDTVIRSYAENTIPLNCADSVTIIPRVDEKVHKPHHLSEIRVTNGDGRRYVYGIPAYSVEQKDVSFAVDKETNSGNLDKGLVSYQPGIDNSVNNNKGKDNFFSQDSMPAYAHSFLLSGILSPDYVDIRGDGITEDDLGDAIKFNYSRIFGNSNNYYEWRVPFDTNKANYNEGMKTYNRDDKGTYMFGKKEIWYLNSVESKTMIAVFKLATNRQDAYAAGNVNGGYNNTKSLRRLERIDLYVKADLIKNGSTARPVKTVHFAYRYDLCKGFAGDPNKGKLTLDSIWFSYNGNEKGRLNPYIFRYNPDASGVPKTDYNPSYNARQYDRWGNYKDPSQNPTSSAGTMRNDEYPYSIQDSSLAGKYVSAWHLTDITLPSGGKMKITYESDDYGYVQHKRAAQMFKVSGIRANPDGLTGSTLYTSPTQDNRYVVFQSPLTHANKQDVYDRFLKGVEYVFFKVAVQMPSDKWGTGYEWVTGYAKVEDYGLVNGFQNRVWVKLQEVQGQSPITRAALEFFRRNLPSKAYPGSEPGDNIDLKDIVMMLTSGFKEIRNSIEGFNKVAKNKSLCRSVDINRSFIRLADPDYKKYGGGVRVKKVEVFDNWNKMTGQRESIYGQEYIYTTTQEENGQVKTISSGVASYEPMIGAEENPFHNPIEYAERLAPMAPVNHLFSEMPLGESFYPSASVGYSKVRVRTINAKAKSANGWQETSYYTTKDFPTIVEHTTLDDEAKKRYNPKLRNFLRIDAVQRISISQGFKIELNDINGKVKSQASYAENDPVNPVSYVRNFYKVDDDRAYQQHLNNTVWVADSLNGHINKNGQIGKDVEIMVDMREQLTKTVANNKSANLDVVPGGIIPAIPIPTMIPLPQKEEVRFRSAATVKIVQRYGILDSVVVMDKGSIVSTKNLVYDAETGGVLLSRTNNEFNDPIYNFSYPAHWAYSGMGMAYKNTDAVFSNLRMVSGRLYKNEDGTPFPVERFFESGDELMVNGSLREINEGACLELGPDQGIPLPNRLWAIDAGKGKENDKGMYFIDKDGKPLSGVITAMKVLRSGKRNFLSAGAGSIVSMANPVREVSVGNFRIVFDTLSKVLNTSAITYKDLWPVENTFYQMDSCYTAIDTGYIENAAPIKSGLLRRGIWRANSDRVVLPQQNVVDSNTHFTASVNQKTNGNGHAYLTRSIIKYNLAKIPANATIQSATLDLYGYPYNGTWTNTTMHGLPGPDLSTFNKAHYLRLNNTHRGNNAKLYPFFYPWNDATQYWNYALPSASASVPGSPDDSCDGKSVNVKDIIAALAADQSRNEGIMIKLENEDRGPSYEELRVLSFCGSILPEGVHPGQCDYCIPPKLNVTFTYAKDTCIKVCRNNINDTMINPYRWGIFGNWRADRSYVFYHDRMESNAAIQQTDIRREGLLKDFTPYWKFTDTILLTNADTTKWVWNSASSMFSNKGAELENYDPLGRYNAGLFGYNQTLAVAVAQNSKYREILSDGFEDYGYKTKDCITCPNPREFDFVNNQTGVSITDSTNHSGRYSLKVNAGYTSTLTVPVTTYAADTVKPAMSIEIDSVYTDQVHVTGMSTAFNMSYKARTPSSLCLGTTTGTALQTTAIDYNWGTTPPVTGVCNRNYTLTWTGYLQAPYTDRYNFRVASGGAMVAKINGVVVAAAYSPGQSTGGATVYLQAGQLYPFTIEYQHTTGSAYAKFQWSRANNPAYLVVPRELMYKNNMIPADSAGSVSVTTQFFCATLNPPKPVNIIKPKFSPLQNSKLVVSAWVKMGGNDCNTAPALENVIIASFNPSSSTFALQKTGVRIEGWQRYEAVVTNPSNATQLLLSLTGVSGRNIYVDDIRVQPYHSNMSSYVYDPVNLRLMAELDANNYASFYEYDDDGSLIRVKKETERGIMTIKETRSATIKDN